MRSLWVVLAMLSVISIHGLITRKLLPGAGAALGGGNSRKYVATLVSAHGLITRRMPRAGAGRANTRMYVASAPREAPAGKNRSRRSRTRKGKSGGFLAWPFAYHEVIKVQIQDLTNLGVGVARVNIDDKMDAEGAPSRGEDDESEVDVKQSGNSWVVMVPKTLPGEEVVCRIFRNFKGYSDADLVEIIKRSDDRVEPQCEHFEKCGGCQYQMMNITAQRAWKTKQVEGLLKHLAGVNEPVVLSTIGTKEEYGYRSKITPHYNAPKHGVDELRIGFQQRGTRIIEDIPSCIIATPAINDRYAERREEIRNSMLVDGIPKKGATLLFRQGVKDGEVHVETNFREIMEEEVMGVTFKYRASEFFQNNAFALPALVQHVMDLVKGDDCENLIDAYCGSGLFSLVGTSHFKATYGVEISELAVKAAEANAELNGITNAQFLSGAAEAIFEKVSHLDKDKTCILLDPPRKGCDSVFLNQLFAFRPKKIVYISCDPATQARDTKEIIQAGYSIRSVQPFDLFPQTRHIENVIYFTRDEHKSSGGPVKEQGL